jgi:hypothetical protein
MLKIETLKKIMLVIILCSFLIYPAVSMDLSFNKNKALIYYTITSKNELNQSIPSSGRIVVKKDNKIIYQEKLYTTVGIYQNNFDISNITNKITGIYTVTYLEDGTNNAISKNIDIKPETSSTSANITTDDKSIEEGDVLSLQSWVWYIVVLLLMGILLYVIILSFKQPSKKEVF